MRTKVRCLAMTRTLYTDESYLQAQQAIEAQPPGSPPIPTPAQAQLNLEARFFEQILDARGEITSHPLGIQAVRPLADTLHLRVDGETTALQLLRYLLPRWETPVGDVHGIPGLRVHRRHSNAIELRQVGSLSSVRLTGLPARWWKLAEAELLSEADTTDVLAWRDSPTAWTPREMRWDSEHYEGAGRYAKRWQRQTWLASGLLRRIALLHTVAACHAADGWKGLSCMPHRWCFDLAHTRDQPPRLAELAAALRDPVFGLDLILDEQEDLHGFVSANEPIVLTAPVADRGEVEFRVLSFAAGTFDTAPARG